MTTTTKTVANYNPVATAVKVIQETSHENSKGQQATTDQINSLVSIAKMEIVAPIKAQMEVNAAASKVEAKNKAQEQKKLMLILQN
ncbi:hypothetical protein H1230_21680 [Paenibacillus sp. 19GGS1-52]|uniref:hypothetical protein n=1 Tax=Paenibacillus sp. 19GGS1-52 TaxID=2758563 RepID=UPI001EFB3849|nr:hypothetical protein [Paenibacillus sp. 19GGS1-52]ULO05664.1 hypothetical protein H1230_21680 [Paenibacillus sp. 19GGS1-52]